MRVMIPCVALAVLMPLTAVCGWVDANRQRDRADDLMEAQTAKGLDADARQNGHDALHGSWHQVADGESLRRIAEQYYGSGRMWRVVQVANGCGQQPAAGSKIWVPSQMPALP